LNPGEAPTCNPNLAAQLAQGASRPHFSDLADKKHHDYITQVDCKFDLFVVSELENVGEMS
jgi:hypothetical protein